MLETLAPLGAVGLVMYDVASRCIDICFLFVAEAEAVYRPRRPTASPLFRLLEALYDRVKLAWEDRFERRYGFWRGLADDAVARYLDCGVLERGFARLECGGCP